MYGIANMIPNIVLPNISETGLYAVFIGRFFIMCRNVPQRPV